MRQLVILAGGRGSRLAGVLQGRPKALVPIGDRPLLGHQLGWARAQGVTRCLILAGYQAEAIREFVASTPVPGLEVEVVVETEPRGTAGAVAWAWDRLEDRFGVVYGDLLVNVDLERMEASHVASGAAATLLLHPNDHPLDSDLVEVDGDGWVRALHRRPHSADRDFANLVNAALYVVEKQCLAPWRMRAGVVDFGSDVFPALLAGGARLRGYVSAEYIKDVGTPERHAAVSAEWAAGVVDRGSLRTRQPAVFLDRDGTLIRDVGGLTEAAQVALLPGVAEGIRLLNRHGWRCVVVTNQPVVAKGFCRESDVDAAHRRLETLLGQGHAYLDRIYYCPHHPDRGFPGERPELKIACDCRKPKPGMLRVAQAALNLDLGSSWMIGDRAVDILTARNAGVRALLVNPEGTAGDARGAAVPDAVFTDLLSAARHIVAQEGRRT